MDGDDFNRTVFGITSPGLRLSLAATTFLVAIISIVGNTLVLMAALKKAIKLDKISVILIKNIGVADTAYALLVISQVKFLIH